MSKYPDIGIMDVLHRLLYGFDNRIPRYVAYTELGKNFKASRSIMTRKVYSLKQRGYLEYSSGQELIITEKGMQLIDFAKLESLTLVNKKHDGLWRVVLFDIPEQKRGARDLLRNKLKEFNCYTLQKSVYVTPYVCEKEINEIAKILDVKQYVQIILAKSLGHMDQKLHKYFKV